MKENIFIISKKKLLQSSDRRCSLHGRSMYLSRHCSHHPKNIPQCHSRVTLTQLGSLVFLHLLLIGTNRVLQRCVVMMKFKLCSKQLMRNYNSSIYPELWYEVLNDPFRDDLRSNTTVIFEVSAPTKGRASACYCVLALDCFSKSARFFLYWEDCLFSFGPYWMLVVGTSLKPLQLQMQL